MSGKIDDKNLELDVNVAEEYYESKVKSNLKRVSEETMRFMRGKYVGVTICSYVMAVI
jgi:hypothetical protein